jgi:aminomethyltransferase
MADLKKTPLYDIHVQSGAKMVDFGGWNMPVQYEGILSEHAAVRERVGLFDVSHMGEIDFRGPQALAAVQYLVTNDISKLVDGRAQYTVTCQNDGGIVDDCIVYRINAQHVRIVVNASNIDKDFAHFVEHAGSMCTITNHSDEYALIAVQGPHARQLCADLGGGPKTLEIPSFGFADLTLANIEVTAARTGYTGEDGFELFVRPDQAPALWKALVAAGATPCGLGARDTLRLEAKLCLYGNDISASTNPYEACLGWVVKPEKGDFVGRSSIVDVKAQGPKRKLIGFRVLERGIVRAHAEILDESGSVVGEVTSGGMAPTVGGSVGMGYVPTELATTGRRIDIRQRGKTLPAEIVAGPFYKRPAST